MNVSGDVTYLPMLNPVRLPYREVSLTPHPTEGQPVQQHRIYRSPPRERQAGFAYGTGGYASIKQINGRMIDLYA